MKNSRSVPATFTGFLLLVCLGGCGGGGSGSDNSRTVEDNSQFDAPDVTDKQPVNLGGDGNLYQPDRVLNIDIQMPEADFDLLRYEGRSFASTFRTCVPEYEYNEFVASVSIDGILMDDVIIRKKGFLGSLSAVRPSFKMDFNDLHKGRTYQNSKRLTLNNNRQDPSNLRQCLAYEIFNMAGLPAPQCNYASVRVNNQELGSYSNVEPIKDSFLRRAFGDDDGNLYEGQRADLGEHLHLGLEIKNNEDSNDRSDLLALSQLLQLPDQDLIAALPQMLDVDEFIRYWALETLIGFWDSATGFSNNYHLYHSTSDNLFHYIPWGPDNAFSDHFFFPESGPLYHNSNLTNRLFQIDEYKQQYLSTLEGYLNDLWVEDNINARIGQLQSLTGTAAENVLPVSQFVNGVGQPGDENYQPSQRQRLQAAIQAERSGTSTQQAPTLLVDEPKVCSEPQRFTLEANLSSAGGGDSGSFSYLHPQRGSTFASIDAAATATDAIMFNQPNTSNPQLVSVISVGADANHQFRPYVLSLLVERPDYQPGSHPFHGFATALLLYDVDPDDPTKLTPIAVGDTGNVQINSTGPGIGDLSISVQANMELISNE